MNVLQKLLTYFKLLWPYISRYRWWAVLTILFVLVKEGSILLEPTIYRGITQVFQQLGQGNISQEAATDASLGLLLRFIGIQAAVLVANYGMLRSVNILESGVMRDAANAFVEKVLHLSFRFHSGRKTGTLAKEFARGISGMEAFMDTLVFSMAPLAVRLFTIILVFAWIDKVIALLLLVLALFFITFTAITGYFMQRQRDSANRVDDEGFRRAADAIMNAEAVKYFQKEEREVTSFRAVRQQWRERKLNEWNGWTLISSGQIAINIVFVSSIIGTMLWRLLHMNGGHGVDVPNFVFIISYMGFAIGMLWEFQHHIRRFHESLTDLSSYFSYFKQENEIQDSPGARSIRITAGRIEFRNIVFGYDPAQPILRNVSFTIPAGKSVAFVGPSGVGKSTIMKLLYRFYDPQAGEIMIDGQNIRTVTQQSLRQALGIVPQEAALFNDTIAYNIAYAGAAAGPEDVRRAARFARINAFIESLPDGYDTMVGERGIKLSGGERQRISIARAVLRNAPILVLDEATSSLDSSTEADIQESLYSLMKGRTTLIIAHRLSTIMNADFIIVLNNGGVEKIGTHRELLEHGGLYNRLWELQAGGYIE